MNYFGKTRESAGANFRRGFGAAAFLVVLLAPGHAQLRATGEFKASTASPTKGDTAPTDESIRPFRIHVPESALVDLRQRLAATRLPDRETVGDQSQGVQLATMKELVRYWQTDWP